MLIEKIEKLALGGHETSKHRFSVLTLWDHALAPEMRPRAKAAIKTSMAASVLLQMVI
ncbi:hypothetical protein RCH14_001140 [Massilia sp. MP_M2]|uniref:hypothetical protein n=1 Tax=Massilia sp. MP_M2 TaxID=3071713 RepID=UPI00319EA964